MRGTRGNFVSITSELYDTSYLPCRNETLLLEHNESLAFGEEGQAGHAGNHQAQGGGQVKDGGKPLAIGQEA